MSSSTAISLMPALAAFSATTGPSALSGTTIAIPFTPSPTIVSNVVSVEIGVELHVLRHQL